MAKKIKVLFASAELTPLAKVGGLADVAGALPPALNEMGADVRIIIPKYGIINEKKYRLKKILADYKVKFNSSWHLIDLYQTILPGTKTIVYLINNTHYLGHGGVYLSADAASIGTKSEFERFGFFSVAILEILKAISWQPEIIHCNDWHVGLVPTLIKTRGLKLKTLTTIHNLAYQGWYNENIVFKVLGLEKKYFHPVKNCIVSLKEAIINSDLLNTVSPTYAKEVLTSAYGCNLEKNLKKRKGDLFGILNGIDVNLFNPATDKLIKAKYTIKSLAKKIKNKNYLQKICRLPQDKKIPLLGIVGRLTEQKGFDLILSVFQKLMGINLQLVILATGDKNYEKEFLKFSQQYKTKFSFQPKFDIKLAQQIYAGSDIFLMPSRFEPCGLGQMIAMGYGTIPLIRAVGGLKDSVKNYSKKTDKEIATGFIFDNYDPSSFLLAINKSLKLFLDKPTWHKLQSNGMKQDFSWNNSAKEYLNLYQKLLA